MDLIESGQYEESVKASIKTESGLTDTLDSAEFNPDWSSLVLEYLDSNSTSNPTPLSSPQESSLSIRPESEASQESTPKKMLEDYVALSLKLNKTPTVSDIGQASLRGEIADVKLLKKTFGNLKALEAKRIKLEMITALQIADEKHNVMSTNYEGDIDPLLLKLGLQFTSRDIEKHFNSVQNFLISAGVVGKNSLEDKSQKLVPDYDVQSPTAQVSRYCEIIDEFIGIKIYDAEQVGQYFAHFTGGRRAYSEAVVRLCVDNYETKLAPEFKKLNRIYKPEALLDVLYSICVEVNPGLEIHQVSLPQATQIEKRNLPINIDIEAIKAKVLGQDEPITAVCRKLKSAFTGLKDPAKPLGAFLFVGKTGGGKTELAKAISEVAFNSKIVRVDCSEYASPHEIAKLFGAPPGYIGHNNGGYLTKSLIENPESVVLFDELEKAHQNLRNTMLQILDEGHLRDGTGKLALFNKSLIIATSNAGVEDLIAAQHPTGFGAANVKPLQGNQVYQVIEPGLRHHFAPEFLNRFTAIVPFNDLDKSTIVGISKLALAKVASYSAIKIEFTPEVAHEIADLAFNPNFQAREVQRTVDREITSTLADIISENVLRPYHCIRVGLSPSKKFTFTVKRDAFSHFDVK